MLTVFAKVYVNGKNILSFYVLKNVNNMTCSTTWYNDIVYSDHLVRMDVSKNIFSLFDNKIHEEKYENLPRSTVTTVDGVIVKVSKNQRFQLSKVFKCSDEQM